MTASPRILALFGARVLFGQERANIEALAALSSEGCEVLCVIRPETWPELLDLRAALQARGLEWVTAPYIDYPVKGWLLHTMLRNPAAYLRGNAALKRIARAFAPTHIHAFNAFYIASFWGALHRLRTPMVYRIGDKPVRHNPFYRAVWRFIVKRAAHFVADSAYIKRELVAIGVESSRVTVLYSPPPLRVDPAKVTLPRAASHAARIRFVYVGQLSKRKGVDLLIDAFRELVQSGAEADLVIAGRISDWSGDDWARALRDKTQGDRPAADRVFFLGQVEDAPELIRQCGVHVAPSLVEEGYGLVVVEAKSVARPSIIFPSGGMAELVTDGVNGAVVADRTAAGLMGAMKLYADDPGLAERHGQAALASVSELGFDRFSQTWRTVYERAAAP